MNEDGRERRGKGKEEERKAEGRKTVKGGRERRSKREGERGKGVEGRGERGEKGAGESRRRQVCRAQPIQLN